MIKSIHILNDNHETLDLGVQDYIDSGFVVGAVEGLGPTKATLWTSKPSTFDGSIFNGARKEERSITMTLVYQPDRNHMIESLRHQTYRIFQEKHRIKITVVTDSRTVSTYGYVENNKVEVFTSREGSSITITCPDPFFTDENTKNSSTSFSNIDNTFEFPFPNYGDVSEFGLVTNSTIKNIQYNGDADTGILIKMKINGPVTNPSIYNEDRHQFIKVYSDRIKAITGTNLKNGDEIDISTSQGNRYVRLLRDGVTTNVLNALDRNVDWISISPGYNSLAYSADSGIENLNISIIVNTLYSGV